MPNPLIILQFTPPWVFGLLALLVVLGCQALRPRTLPVWRLLLLPLVFGTWGLVTLATRSVASPVLLLAWVVAATAGLLVAWRTARLDRIVVDRLHGRVDVPGSALPLIRNLLVFSVKYILTAAIAIVPAHQDSLILWNFGFSGLMAGYFIGWLVRFALKYRMAVAPSV